MQQAFHRKAPDKHPRGVGQGPLEIASIILAKEDVLLLFPSVGGDPIRPALP